MLPPARIGGDEIRVGSLALCTQSRVARNANDLERLPVHQQRPPHRIRLRPKAAGQRFIDDHNRPALLHIALLDPTSLDYRNA